MKKGLIIILFTTLLLFVGCEKKEDTKTDTPSTDIKLTSEKVDSKTYEFSKDVKSKNIKIKLDYQINAYKNNKSEVDHYEIAYKLSINGGFIGRDYNDYNNGISSLYLVLSRNTNYDEIDSLIKEYNKYIDEHISTINVDNGYILLPIYTVDENNIGETKLLSIDNEGRVFGGITIRKSNEKISNIENNINEYEFSQFKDETNTFLIKDDGYYVISCNAPKDIKKSDNESLNAYEYKVDAVNNELFVNLVNYAKAKCN